MIGAFLNGLGILAGALFGASAKPPQSARTQYFLKSALGAFTVWFGLRLIGDNVHGNFLAGGRQLAIATLSVALGFWIGKILGLQKISNRLGRHAARLLAAAQKDPPGKSGAGLLALTILFCAAPLGILGAIVDGLANDFSLLSLKAVMDGLAMVSFIKIYRWPVALAAIPVTLFLNGLTFAVHFELLPWLQPRGLVPPLNVAAGLITCMIMLVILELRRVELVNYLPGLIIAPLLAYGWLG